MQIPRQSQATERMLIVRVALTLGLALLLLVGAWSDSHGDGDGSSALCLAVDVSPGSAVDHHDTTTSADVAPDAGALGACGIVVFLLVALVLRLFAARTVRVTGGSVAASVPPRAGPARFAPVLTLTQLSISRT